MGLLRISFVVLALSLPASAHAQGAIFSFVDANGQLHLSNVEEDRSRGALGDAGATRRAAQQRPSAEALSQPKPGFRAVIETAAARHGVDAALLQAVIAVESGFDPNAVSRRKAGGLMQLTPETAVRYGVANVFDPADNVRAGAQFLADLLKRFDDDLELALAAYNAGEGAVLQHGRRIPPFRETVAYVPKVMAAYRKYRSAL
jgi:soluble lytic murein transglycosylase-like protein